MSALYFFVFYLVSLPSLYSEAGEMNKVNRTKKFQKLSRKKAWKKYFIVEGKIISLLFFFLMLEKQHSQSSSLGSSIGHPSLGTDDNHGKGMKCSHTCYALYVQHKHHPLSSYIPQTEFLEKIPHLPGLFLGWHQHAVLQSHKLATTHANSLLFGSLPRESQTTICPSISSGFLFKIMTLFFFKHKPFKYY